MSSPANEAAKKEESSQKEEEKEDESGREAAQGQMVKSPLPVRDCDVRFSIESKPSVKGRVNLMTVRRRAKIRNKNFALAILCLCALMQNIIVGGANNAVLTTIEKAYYMTSIETALFLTMYDIANIIASPIIGYFGDRKFKPRIVGFSMVGLSIANLLMILPECLVSEQRTSYDGLFSSSSYNSSKNETNFNLDSKYTQLMCNLSQSSTANRLVVARSISSMSSKSPPVTSNPLLNNMKYFFYLANIINGVSSVSLYTIVISYIESLFSKGNVNLRQGVYYATGAIGVGIGMLVTGNFLNFSYSLKRFYDPNANVYVKQLITNPNSVNFIGAWWIIYMIAIFIDLILAIFLFCFSPKLTLHRDDGVSETVVGTMVQSSSAVFVQETSRRTSQPTNQLSVVVTDTVEPKTFTDKLKDFLKNALLIIKNRVFILIVVCTTFETFLIKGFSSYLSKFLQYQYRLAASTATMIVGAIGFLSLVLGVLLGSLLVKYFKWHIKQCALFVTIILSFTSFLFLGLLVSGPQEQLVYANNPHYEESMCNCDMNTFYPVCYNSEYLFPSPCFAGCRKILSADKFYDCKVLKSLLKSPRGPNSTSSSLTLADTILENSVLQPCPRPNPRGVRNLVLVSFVGFAILFLSSIVIMPILRVILESISKDNQSFALGIRSLVNKLFGNIPGPIVFAAVVDQSCLVWTKNVSRSAKTCNLFNNRQFSFGLGFLGFGLRVLSAVFAFICLTQIKRHHYETDDNSLSQSTITTSISNVPPKNDTESETTQNQPQFTYTNKAYEQNQDDNQPNPNPQQPV